jgi:hypothetical protein
VKISDLCQHEHAGLELDGIILRIGWMMPVSPDDVWDMKWRIEDVTTSINGVFYRIMNEIEQSSKN